MRERFWDEGPEGLVAVLGEPVVLEVESEGEARTSLEAPPPLLDCAPGPLVAAAAEEAKCEAAWGAMVLDPLEDSSWLAGSCCPAWGEKGDDVDEAADDARAAVAADAALSAQAAAAQTGSLVAPDTGSIDVVPAGQRRDDTPPRP